jgi:CubicO group peptidase (beta-lactamase class C family)
MTKPESETHFPAADWEPRPAEALGFDPARLDQARRQIDSADATSSYRIVIVRGGYLAAEWSRGVDADSRKGQASASKSYFSCLLGIAEAEEVIPSADAKVVDVYPEMMNVGDGEGPKPGRYAFDKDRDITFRQLICNTSGYMKPGETPGMVFHYQTFGMNILTNALATAYGLYDSDEPERLPGANQLLAQKIRDPIGGVWEHAYTDFDHPPGVKKGIFGHSSRVVATARETARAGWLWLNGGRWRGTQVVPAAYLHGATKTNDDILAHEPEENWHYGHGFWTNDHGKLWPDLLRDSFAARGAGAKLIWVCPSLDLMVTQNPGVWEDAGMPVEQNRNIGAQLAAIADALQ